jgi:cell shape-determining protein MreC
MFEKWGDYSVRELRIQFAEENRQYYEPLLAERDQRLAQERQRVAALERENAELRKMRGVAPSV